MIYAVFLCDQTWKIKKIRQCREEMNLAEGERLTDMVLEKEKLQKLQNVEEKQYALELTFRALDEALSVTIQTYREGSLVVAAKIRDQQEFLEFQNTYPEYLEWGKDCIFGIFRSEYYMIQQMNNQLVDARRMLTRSNRRLELALRENEEVNRKLDEARKIAENASSSKTRFLANMSHDIRTPMNAIVGLTELMGHHLNEPDLLKRYLQKLSSSSQYLLDLINDILDLSKIENGSMELKTESMDLGAQLEQIFTIVRPQFAKKKQELLVQKTQIAHRYLQGDPVRFRQILMNLFSNAVKYTPEGGTVRFSMEEMEFTGQERKYRFIIEDSGIGMTQEFIRHIFEPFARAEASVREIQGTGLGMAITKSIVDAMQGEIRVESTPGKGSRFTVELPFLLSEENAAEEMERKTKEAEVASAVEAEDLKGKRFLCAEDNELNAEILKSMLEMEGASCTIYANGRLLTEAFADVMPGEYDAVLMDVQMPVMDGYEATRQIRGGKNPLGKTIPIIAMTANAFAEDVERAKAAGMNAHIAKPLDFQKLRAIYRQVSGTENGKDVSHTF